LTSNHDELLTLRGGSWKKNNKKMMLFEVYCKTTVIGQR